LDILDIPHGSIPYILSKLKKGKKSGAVSAQQHALKAVWVCFSSRFFPLTTKSKLLAASILLQHRHLP